MAPQVLIYAAILGLILADIGISIVAYMQLKSFLASHERLTSEGDLKAPKTVAKANMYASITVMLLILAGVCLLVAGFWAANFGLPNVAAVSFAFAALSWATGLPLANLESRVKALPVDKDEMKAEFDRLVNAWNSRMFPDW